MNSRHLSLLAHDVRTLQLVQKHGPASLAILRVSERQPLPIEPLADRLADLVGLGLVQRSRKQRGGAPLFALTDAGTLALAAQSVDKAAGALQQCGEAAAAASTAGEALAAAFEPFQAKPGHYDGAELRPYTGRGPEALRAFTLPSLVNGERVERVRPPIIMASTKPDRLRDGRGR